MNAYPIVLFVPTFAYSARAIAQTSPAVRIGVAWPLGIGLAAAVAALFVVRPGAPIPVAGLVPQAVAADILVRAGVLGFDPLVRALALAIAFAIAVALIEYDVRADARLRRLRRSWDRPAALVASVALSSTSQQCRDTAAGRLPLGCGFVLSAVGVVILAALALDVWSAAAHKGPLVRLTAERHAVALAAIERALATAAIPAVRRSGRLFSCMMFCPLVPVELWVHPEALDRARSVLARLDRGEGVGIDTAQPSRLSRALLAILCAAAVATSLESWWSVPTVVP